MDLLPPRPTTIKVSEHEKSRFTDDLHPASIYQDNTSAITIIQDVVYNGRTKHLDIRLKRLRELVRSGVIHLTYLKTDLQLADVFTKGLSQEAHERHTMVLFGGGMISS
jgi:hypothetical protein